MATEKVKKVKVGTDVPKKVSTEKEVSKKPSIASAEEKTVVSETKRSKKATAPKEEKLSAQLIEAAPVEKKAKTSVPKTQPSTTPEFEAIAKPEPTATKPVAKKASVAKKTTVAKVKEAVAPVAEAISDAIEKVIAPVINKPTEVVAQEEKIAQTQALKVTFQLKYSTRFGQKLVITGTHEVLGNGDVEQAFPMQYFNHEYWFAEVELPIADTNIGYSYTLLDEDGSIIKDGANDKVFNPAAIKASDVLIVDTWTELTNENNLYSEPLTAAIPVADSSEVFTHIFKVKSPVLPENHVLFIAGNVEELGSWTEENLKLLNRAATGNLWTINLDLSKASLPVIYKYGVYNTKEKKVVEFELGDDRVFYGSVEAKDLTIITDGFANLSQKVLKMAV